MFCLNLLTLEFLRIFLHRYRHHVVRFMSMAPKLKAHQMHRLLLNTGQIQDWHGLRYGCPNIRWRWPSPIFVYHKLKDGKFRVTIKGTENF